MNIDEAIKIIICGLDGAGKTSILRLLEQVYGFEDKIDNLAPTIGIEYKFRSIFGKQFIFWDFGGQSQFREKYLHNQHYFLGTKLMYYLIDIQDEERFDQSIQYLGEILKILESELESAPFPILICFHKSDIDIIHNPSMFYYERVNMIKDLLVKTYPTIYFEFFYTSIYDIATILLIHSKTINRFIPKTQLLDEICVKFYTKFPVLRILLIDQTGFPILNFYTESYATRNLQEQIELLLNYQLRMLNLFEDQKHNISNTQSHLESMDQYLYRFRAKRTSNTMKDIDLLKANSAFKMLEERENSNESANEVNYYLLIYSQKTNPEITDADIKSLIMEFQSIIK